MFLFLSSLDYIPNFEEVYLDMIQQQPTRNSRHNPPKERNFVCGECNKGYNRIENLMRHQRLECQKEPGFVCDICQRAFYRRYEMVNHKVAIHGFDKSQLKVKTNSF